MKILVIGSEGFIGRFLTQDLLGLGHGVVGLDVRQAEDGRRSYPLVLGDILNETTVLKAAEGVDVVINLAAKHHDFGISREDFFLINETGTKKLLRCLTGLKIRKFIFFSSVAVYGDIPECSSEDKPLTPSNDYGESKLAAEELINAWAAEDSSRSVVVIRPTVVFGPYNYANMHRLIEMIYKRRFLFVGPGDNIKTVTYVENLVDATLFLLSRMKPGIDFYNYADYPHYTASKLVSFINRCLDRKDFSWHLPLKPILLVAGIIDWLGNITKINFPITAKRIAKINAVTWHGSEKIRSLGFVQKVSIEEGLKKMVDWYLAENQ
jgi:GlcNAc-P-P-Und epimerase